MKNKYTPETYSKRVDEISKDSKVVSNTFRAFIFGGLICVVGELILRFYYGLGIDKDSSSNLTVITMIFLGALLTGLNIYDNFGKYAGAGSIIPITGFANSIVAPAMEFKSEGYVLGVGARMFVIAGPVLVYGVITSVVCGLIYYLINIR